MTIFGEPDGLKLHILLAYQKQYDLCISSDIMFFLAKPWLDHMVAGHTYYKAVQTGKVSHAYYWSVSVVYEIKPLNMHKCLFSL